MEFVCVSARFSFFNGQIWYTVDFRYSSMTWYVFHNDQQSNAIYVKKINPRKSKTPTRDLAKEILDEYMDTQLNGTYIPTKA